MKHKMVIRKGMAVLDGNDMLSRQVEADGWSNISLAIDLVAPLLKPGDTVVDAGAALGDHTVNYLKAVGENGNVIAFEPHPEFFKCLQINCPQALAFNCFLWDSDSDAMCLFEESGNVGASCAVPANANHTYGPISTKTLDSLELLRLDMLKMDCEGTEVRCLRGARETIQRCRPKIVAEVQEWMLVRQNSTPQQFYDLLSEMGYDWRSVRGDPSKTCTMCDIIAWHKDTPEPWP